MVVSGLSSYAYLDACVGFDGAHPSTETRVWWLSGERADQAQGRGRDEEAAGSMIRILYADSGTEIAYAATGRCAQAPR